jgi:hypothetical protein
VCYSCSVHYLPTLVLRTIGSPFQEGARIYEGDFAVGKEKIKLRHGRKDFQVRRWLWDIWRSFNGRGRSVPRTQTLKLAKSSPARHAHTRAHATHAHALPNLATSGTAWARGVKQWRKHATYKEYACITVDITDSDSRSSCTVRRSMAQVILIVVLW